MTPELLHSNKLAARAATPGGAGGDAEAPARRGRGRPPSVPWPGVDWSMPDAEIARRRGVTREAVRQARIRYGGGPPWSKPGVWFREFVGHNAPRLQGRTASEALEEAGVRLSGEVARMILRAAGVRVAREPVASKLDDADWRLPNLDLARAWRVTPETVSNRRRRVGAAKAKWDLRDPRTPRDPEYLKLVELEKQRADQVAARAPVDPQS